MDKFNKKIKETSKSLLKKIDVIVFLVHENNPIMKVVNKGGNFT